MTDEVGNLILERLRRLDARLDVIEGDLHDIKLRTSLIESNIGTMVASIAGLNHRMDRFDERLGRVERRLELTEAR